MTIDVPQTNVEPLFVLQRTEISAGVLSGSLVTSYEARSTLAQNVEPQSEVAEAETSGMESVGDVVSAATRLSAGSAPTTAAAAKSTNPTRSERARNTGRT